MCVEKSNSVESASHGKPFARRGRKAVELKPDGYDCRAAIFLLRAGGHRGCLFFIGEVSGLLVEEIH